MPTRAALVSPFALVAVLSVPAGPASANSDLRTPAAERCGAAGIRHVGPGTVLRLAVRGPSCDRARHLVRAYQSCLESESGRAGRCYAGGFRRCVQPTFLGRCRLWHRFLVRRVQGYRCTERRLYAVGELYEGHVTCRRGDRRVSHDYTLFTDAPVSVGSESELRAAWANPRMTGIELHRDLVLNACRLGDPIRESGRALTLDGNGHALRQGCFEKRLLRQDGTGYLELRDVTLTRGGSDGPGAAVTTRGEITLVDSVVRENLAEEPGGGVFSQRRATVIRSIITGNLANDDGGGVYARRGGVRVYDSTISANLVDGSGGAIGSTGDILVVRSHIDGNTTDGDGGAIYADEDGDVTVIDSTVDGSTADGPGGAIFTLDGDVTVVNSTLNGNRADDRGGAISGEADVTVINSTIARNAAVAHVGGGIWARGSLIVANSTISTNYSEGVGGGLFAAGDVTLLDSTVTQNIAPVAANLAAGDRLTAFGSIIGPARIDSNGGEVQPTEINCRVSRARSYGYNFVSDHSCGLVGAGDVFDGGPPGLGGLRDNGGTGETHLPEPLSPVLDRIPGAVCLSLPFADPFHGSRALEGLVESPFGLLRTDQRGVTRPTGSACDTGAAER
jgi:predicted outer membrane repeat protein